MQLGRFRMKHFSSRGMATGPALTGWRAAQIRGAARRVLAECCLFAPVECEKCTVENQRKPAGFFSHDCCFNCLWMTNGWRPWGAANQFSKQLWHFGIEPALSARSAWLGWTRRHNSFTPSQAHRYGVPMVQLAAVAQLPGESGLRKPNGAARRTGGMGRIWPESACIPSLGRICGRTRWELGTLGPFTCSWDVPGNLAGKLGDWTARTVPRVGGRAKMVGFVWFCGEVIPLKGGNGWSGDEHLTNYGLVWRLGHQVFHLGTAFGSIFCMTFCGHTVVEYTSMNTGKSVMLCL